jgi:hypothetical protein
MILYMPIISKQVKFAGTNSNTICAAKQTILPAMLSTVINAKFKGQALPEKTYIANIFLPKTPIISGMLSIISIDENNNCKVIVDNCPPHDLTIEQNHFMGMIEVEEEALIQLTDDVISSVCTAILNCFPKITKRKLSRKDIGK